MIDKPDLSKIDAYELTQELRRRGLAVCVFGPEDLQDRDETEEWTDDQMADWMVLHAGNLEDVLSERGNQYIDDMLAMKSFDADVLDEDP